jgi:hypothetical protein
MFVPRRLTWFSQANGFNTFVCALRAIDGHNRHRPKLVGVIVNFLVLPLDGDKIVGTENFAAA